MITGHNKTPVHIWYTVLGDDKWQLKENYNRTFDTTKLQYNSIINVYDITIGPTNQKWEFK